MNWTLGKRSLGIGLSAMLGRLRLVWGERGQSGLIYMRGIFWCNSMRGRNSVEIILLYMYVFCFDILKLFLKILNIDIVIAVLSSLPT